MHNYINELEVLECIMDTLIFENEPSIFNEEYILDIIETALHLMDNYMENNPTIISEPDFNDIILEEITDIFLIQFEDHISNNYDDTIEEDIEDIVEIAFNIYISTFHTERSIQNSDIIYDEENTDEKIEIIKEKINKLRNIPQPTQRTIEWYKFRHNLITASNAYKAFETQNTINQLIYEKCLPIKINLLNEEQEIKMVNVNTTLHWGQKYEPLSVMIYENMFDSKVEDFGCIQHSNYKFIGASPDGIIIESNTGRFGRMLEIKNIVNREINGIPKKEYWIQTQLQMEVCDLDECDFLETKFIEYEDYISYENDMSDKESDFECTNFCLSKENKMKGQIIHFHTKEGKPFYLYKPLNIILPEKINEWCEYNIDYYTLNSEFNYTFIKTIYWKLEKLSCVLVLRNKEWFKNNIGQLAKVWNIIEEERVNGYGHRAPVKKIKKENSVNNYFETNQISTCLLTVKKLI